MASPPTLTTSVVITTYNRALLLDECLAHMSRQDFLVSDEVIVVDNDSRDHTKDVVTNWMGRFPVPLRYVHEAASGKSQALTSGIAHASGDILALTDDDVNVADEWLSTIRGAMSDGTIALLGGRVRARWQSPPPPWLRMGDPHYWRFSSPLALLDYGPEPQVLGARTAVGANLVLRRDVLQALGGFAAHLGKQRGTLLSGEDDDVCRRVQAAGLRAMYWPASVVYHWVPADRMTVRYFVKWFFWWGITNAVLDGPPTSARLVFGVPPYWIREFVSGVARTVVATLKLRSSDAVLASTHAAYAAGYAWHCWRTRRHDAFGMRRQTSRAGEAA
jgi:GT2 family glycosyltransferase